MSKNLKKCIAIIAGSLLIMSLATGCSSTNDKDNSSTAMETSTNETETSNDSTEKVYQLKVYNPMPPTSIPTQSLIKMAEIAEKNSDGRLKFDVKHSGQLGADREAIESTKMGTIDIVMSGTGVYGSFYEDVKIFDLPFLFKDEEQARKVVNGEIGERIFSGLNEQGLVYLATGNNGMRQVSSKTKIHSVEDVEGLKIRLPEMPTYLAVWKSWGATPVPIPISELYTSLKTGVVDAQDNAPYHTVATKSYEVQPYYAMIDYMWMGLTAVINEEKYNSLPEDLQKVIKDAAIEACGWSFDAIGESNEEAFITMGDAGVEVDMEPDRESFRKNLPEIYEQFSKEAWFNQEIIDEINNLN